MLLECGHAAQNLLAVQKAGPAPLDVLFSFRAGFMNQLTQATENGLSEGRGIFDIAIDSWVHRKRQRKPSVPRMNLVMK
jgi:hypothetical protein